MAEQPSISWWGRNWKWVAPVGCLGIVAVVFLLVGSILVIVTGSMKSSWAYENAVELAKSNPAVAAAVGKPIETGWFTTGSIEVSGPSGEAELGIPIRGSREQGTLYVIAEKQAGQWAFQLVELEVRGSQERIPLLENPAPGPVPIPGAAESH